MIVLEPGASSLSDLEWIWRTDEPVRLAGRARKAVDRAAGVVARAAEGDQAIYGVNTGFGKLANIKIALSDTAKLQRNLVLSHCCGVGDLLEPATVRLMMALKLLSIGRGASGVSWQVVALIEDMVSKGVLPVIPEQGSVGASGDLAPLAHMAAAMMGEGEVVFQGRRMPARAGLAAAGLSPVAFGPKEGLGLINGTQFSTACALTGLFDAKRNLLQSLVSSALSTDAVMGSTAPFLAEIHELRGHSGQKRVARAIRELIAGSEIRDSHREGDGRVQDPYCIRCQPQVTGAALDLLDMAGRTLETEANAVSDNPLVLVDRNEIVSGGNFHAEPVAFAADMIALAIAEIGAIAQRRIAVMVDPALSFHLPPFLTCEPLRTSPALRKVVAVIRARIPRLDEDRFLAPDLAEMSVLVRDAHLSRAAGLPEGIDEVPA